MTNCEIGSVLLLKKFVQKDTQPFYMPRSQMYTSAMIVPVFTFLVLIFSTAKCSLQITNHDYPLMHFTKLMSEEIFTPGLPLGVMLPRDLEDSANKEVGYLIEELHTSGRWPMVVYNISYDMKRHM